MNSNQNRPAKKSLLTRSEILLNDVVDMSISENQACFSETPKNQKETMDGKEQLSFTSCKKIHRLRTSDIDSVQSLQNNLSFDSNLNPIDAEKLRLKLKKLVKIQENYQPALTSRDETATRSQSPQVKTLKQLKRHEYKKTYASYAKLF